MALKWVNLLSSGGKDGPFSLLHLAAFCYITRHFCSLARKCLLCSCEFIESLQKEALYVWGGRQVKGQSRSHSFRSETWFTNCLHLSFHCLEKHNNLFGIKSQEKQLSHKWKFSSFLSVLSKTVQGVQIPVGCTGHTFLSIKYVINHVKFCLKRDFIYCWCDSKDLFLDFASNPHLKEATEVCLLFVIHVCGELLHGGKKINFSIISSYFNALKAL